MLELDKIGKILNFPDGQLIKMTVPATFLIKVQLFPQLERTEELLS
jgi:hypothetical protein